MSVKCRRNGELSAERKDFLRFFCRIPLGNMRLASLLFKTGNREVFIMSNKKNFTRKLCIAALLTAAAIVLSRLVPVINLWNTKVDFSFAAVMLAACILGPVGGLAVGGLADFIGAILFPIGAYFPGFTATAALTGFVFGLLLYKKCNIWRILIAVLSTQLVCGFLLNTLFISILYTKAFTALLVTRIVQFAVMSAVEILFAELAIDRTKLPNKLKAL